jgi:hypothetical protein
MRQIELRILEGREVEAKWFQYLDIAETISLITSCGSTIPKPSTLLVQGWSVSYIGQ